MRQRGVALSEVLNILELPLTFVNFQGVRTVGEAQVRLDTIKNEAKKQFKRLALKYHPDRQGGDADRFQKMSAAHDLFQRTPIENFLRPIRQPVVYQQWQSVDYGTTTASSSGTSSFSMGGCSIRFTMF